jgi:hypothetical protein
VLEAKDVAARAVFDVCMLCVSGVSVCVCVCACVSVCVCVSYHIATCCPLLYIYIYTHTHTHTHRAVEWLRDLRAEIASISNLDIASANPRGVAGSGGGAGEVERVWREGLSAGMADVSSWRQGANMLLMCC